MVSRFKHRKHVLINKSFNMMGSGGSDRGLRRMQVDACISLPIALEARGWFIGIPNGKIDRK